jgi:hypothetical protein
VESHSRIGIYLRKDRATVVCLASQGREKKLLDSFCITVEDQGQQNQQVLADRIAKWCSEHRLKIVEASVALDCTLFMQHRFHSDFSDLKKIAATVRFDTEETLATDISDLAVAFRVVSSNESGSELDVFTAERSVLSDILLSLQSNGIDPLTVEPDIFLLSRYLCEGAASGGAKGSALYALLSDCRGYLVGTADSGTTMMRAFPISPSLDRNELLAREILLSAALTDSASPPQRLYVVNVVGNLDTKTLEARVRLPVESCDLAGMMGTEAPKAADGPNIVDFAIAFGAALPREERAGNVSFRNDHMPHLGKKMRLHNAVRFCSIAMTILLLTVGVYVQTEFLTFSRDRERLFDKFEPDYVWVMLDRSRLPKTIKEGVANLEGLLRRIKQEKTGQYSGNESVSAKMTLVIQALKSCTAETDLKIDSITIAGFGIVVTGNTSSRANTDKVFAAMQAVGLEIGSHGYEERNNRDTFTMTVKPANGPGR